MFIVVMLCLFTIMMVDDGDEDDGDYDEDKDEDYDNENYNMIMLMVMEMIMMMITMVLMMTVVNGRVAATKNIIIMSFFIISINVMSTTTTKQ